MIPLMKKISILFALLLFGVNSMAQYGKLDAAFGTNGVVLFSADTPVSTYAVADFSFQSDGKIICVGSGALNGSSIMFLARFKTNGMIDTSFNKKGYLIYTPPGYHVTGRRVCIQADGKFVVCSYDYSPIFIRFKSNGSIDSTFGTNGFVVTDMGPSQDYPVDMKLQSDGKIIAGIEGQPALNKQFEFTVVRLNTNGTIDTTFDHDGYANVDLVTGSYGHDATTSLALQSNGKIIVAGTCEVSQINHKYGLTRLNSNGSLDKTFGTNGIVLAYYPQNNSQDIINEANDVLVQSDDKILLCGINDNFGTRKVTGIVGRFNSNGAVDISFGINGFSFSSWDEITQFSRMVLQPDGKVLVCGYNQNYISDMDVMVTRIHANGTTDTTFGVKGQFTTALNKYEDRLNSIGITPSGAILAVGTSVNFGMKKTDIELLQLTAGNIIGIQNKSKISSPIFFYPNPANAYLTVEINHTKDVIMKGEMALTDIVIFDIRGVENYHNVLTSSDLENEKITIDTKDFSEGIYFLRRSSINGSVTQKIVIQH